MSKGLVVARYKESIKWLNDISDIFDSIYLYNKGGDTEIDCLNELNDDCRKKIEYKELENVGREGHTYLWHILNRRDKLEDKLIFTQAEPFDHLIKKQMATLDFFKDRVVNYMNSKLDFEGFGGKHYIWYVGLGGKRNDILKQLHTDLFENEFIENYKFNNGGIFGVTKDTILNRTSLFYQHIMDTRMSTHINPHEGFVLERLWVLIFNKKWISKK